MSIATLLTKVAQAREPHENSDYWYPSELGYCERKAVLRRAGVAQQPIDDQTSRVFWMGNKIHEALQGAVAKEIGGRVLHEVPYRDEEYRISGRHDNLREDESGEWSSIEWKSIRSRAFDYQLPKPAHILQSGAGLTFPAVVNGVKVLPKRCHLVYWSKDDARIAEYVIVGDEQLKAAVLEKLAKLESFFQQYKKDSSLPPALPMIPRVDAKGAILRYKKSGRWGKAGTPMMRVDPLVNYCAYKGTGSCCGD